MSADVSDGVVGVEIVAGVGVSTCGGIRGSATEPHHDDIVDDFATMPLGGVSMSVMELLLLRRRI